MLHNIHQDGERLHKLIQKFLLYVDLELTSRSPERIALLRQERLVDASQLLIKIAQEKAVAAGRTGDLRLGVERSTLSIGKLFFAHLCEEIIENAFKFSRPGTPVTVEAYVSPEKKPKELPGKKVYISITDQGRGMRAEQIAQVGAYLQFERDKYEQQGMGMGLATSRHIAELHGGSLNITSQPGKFTTVSIALPVADRATEPGTVTALRKGLPVSP
jgi:two-component system, sensor histidine kinase and response regulator